MNNNNSIEDAWKVWIDCLGKQDAQSIYNQITNLTWDEGIYQMILKCRQLTMKQFPKNAPINGYLHSSIDRMYSKSTFVGIRKVIGSRSKDSLYGEKGVFSLQALLKDICLHRSELTREVYFGLRNVPYDIEEMRKKENNYFHLHCHPGIAITIPREVSASPTLDGHRLFDQFSETNCINRSKTDIVSLAVLDSLKHDLGEADQIIRYTSKYIAHAATPESLATYQKSPISHKNVKQVLKLITTTLNSLTGFILDASYLVFPLEQPDFFEHWSSPLLPPNNEDLLREDFEAFRKETESWIGT